MLYQIIFETTKDQAEKLGSFLEEAGALSVSFLDAEDEPIFEPAPGALPLWENVQLIALFSSEDEIHSTLRVLEKFLGKLPLYKVEAVEMRDWVTETQQQFQPQCVAEKFWIYPEWETIPSQSLPVLKLAPGLAFGTGTHPTTHMCLEALAAYVKPGMEVIDYGCGSGILGLAALALGASHALLTDIDPQALESSARNAQSNAFQKKALSMYLASELPSCQADVLVANILAGPLVALKPTFEKLLKPTGKIILSGLLASQAEELIAAYAPWRRLHVWKQCEEWICLVG